ncbi:tetratricopeptide repeat protein [Amycolatopsis sp. lyj-84]|uniref:tetratricopeptide repeat protein n=1 Tax=Amycolatopsis sp. lyj-84 TaxID=2789284 RepID=UPI00397C733E
MTYNPSLVARDTAKTSVREIAEEIKPPTTGRPTTILDRSLQGGVISAVHPSAPNPPGSLEWCCSARRYPGIMEGAHRNVTWKRHSNRGTMAGAPHEPFDFTRLTGAFGNGLSERDDRLELPVQRGTAPQQLPMAPPWCVGREEESSKLTAVLLPDEDRTGPPVVLVEGAAGVGKTTLALRWAHRHAGFFPDGQLYADLRGFDARATPASPETILRGFLLAMRTDPNAIPSNADAAAGLYRSAVASRRMLIFLDNAWDAAQVLLLLPGVDSCAVIVTTRRHLPSLTMRGATTMRLTTLSPHYARHFLSKQLTAEVLDADFQATAAVIRRCGGLPLALSLVASRVVDHPGFPMSVLADELREESTMLNAFNAGDDASDLRAVLSWSAAILSGETARAFRMLGIAPLSEFTAVTVACLLDSTQVKAEEILRSLETANLVQRYKPKRFRVHDLVRAYASELLEAEETARSREEALRRVVDFYAAAARAADLLLYPHRRAVPPPQTPHVALGSLLADELAALAWFDEEHQTLLAVQKTALDELWHEAAWHMSHGLDTYQYRRGFSQENVASSQIGLAAAEATGSRRLLASAMRQLGRAHTRAGDLRSAEFHLRQALDLETSVGFDTGQAHAHHDLQRVYSLLGQHDAALEHATAALALYRRVGSAVGEAHSLNAQGRQYAELRNFTAAEECCRKALALHTENDNASGRIATLDSLGYIAQRTGRPEEAATCYSDALVLAGTFHNHFAEAGLNESLGCVLAELGANTASARALHAAHDLYAAQNRQQDADRVRTKLTPDRSTTDL